MSVNLVVLHGNLTRDPEMKYIPNGSAVTNFSIAINRVYNKQDGEKGQETTFVDLEAWDKTAEIISQYFKKGDPILVRGSLKLDTWEADGQKRNRLKVRVDTFDFVSKSSDSSSSSGSSESTRQEEPVGVGADENPDIPF